MGSIVVGVDGSDLSVAALNWAIDEAQRRGAVVEVVHAWSVPFTDPYLPVAMDPQIFSRSGTAVLARVIERCTTPPDSPTLVPKLVQGTAADVLVEASEDADLLVVGSQGHGALAGAILGSVTQRVLQHARCPVVVIRTAPAPVLHAAS